jgi:hypothetical protein
MKKIYFVLFIVFFISCSERYKLKRNPCYNKICINGWCSEGKCYCRDGYSGEDCSVQLIPKKIEVFRIDLISFSMYDSTGKQWDESALLGMKKPDIYLILKEKERNTTILDTRDYNGATWKDCKPGDYKMNVPFYPKPKVELTKTNDQFSNYELEIYDEDSKGKSELMMRIEKQIYDSKKGFPEEIIFEKRGYYVKFYVNYFW